MATRKKRRRPVEDDDEVAPRRKKSSKSKATGGKGVVKLDLRKTEHGKAGGLRVKQGEYKVKIMSAERVQAQSGNTQIKLKLKILDGVSDKAKGKEFFDRLTLTEAAMHRVGWLLDAVGIKWTQKVMSLPLNKLIGKVIGVQLFDDEYNNRITSKVAEYYSKDEVEDLLSDEDDEDEDDDEDEEDDEDEDDEDFDDEDEDEEDDDDEDLDELDDDDL